MTRRCQICGQDRSVPDEIKAKGLKCADCRKRLRKEYERAYNAKHRKRKTAYSRAYYKAHRDQVRATQRMWYEVNREKRCAQQRDWNEANKEHRREYMRDYFKRWYAELRKDPVRWADYLERKRIEDRLRNERRGTPLAPATGRGLGWKPAFKRNHTAPLVDAEPLAAWLSHEFAAWDVTDLARRIGVDDSHLQKLMNGKQRHVSLHVADKILVGADCPHLLDLLYPEAA